MVLSKWEPLQNEVNPKLIFQIRVHEFSLGKPYTSSLFFKLSSFSHF